MQYLISLSYRVRKPAWGAVKAALLGWLILLTACTTAKGPARQTRTYSETQLGRNIFAVRVPETAHTSEVEAKELWLLRCAEVTLAYNFRYFVVLETAQEQQTPTIAGLTPRSDRPRDIGLSSIDSEGALLSPVKTIACFRTQPTAYTEANEAAAVLSRLAGRYGVPKTSEARINPADALPLQFKLNPSFLLLAKTTPEQIEFLEPKGTRESIAIGVLNDWENPCPTIDEFKRKAALAASILGGQGIQIQSESGAVQHYGPGAFSAALLLLPKARLGLQNENGPWPRTELVVKGFDKESLAPEAGLKVGDRIVALNGVDIRQEKRFADAWLSWSVGESVVVTFVRDGTDMTLQAKTITN